MASSTDDTFAWAALTVVSCWETPMLILSVSGLTLMVPLPLTVICEVFAASVVAGWLLWALTVSILRMPGITNAAATAPRASSPTTAMAIIVSILLLFERIVSLLS